MEKKAGDPNAICKKGSRTLGADDYHGPCDVLATTRQLLLASGDKSKQVEAFSTLGLR